MSEKNEVKRTREMDVEGRRPRGRPCKNWIENIGEDMKNKGLSDKMIYEMDHMNCRYEIK